MENKIHHPLPFDQDDAQEPEFSDRFKKMLVSLNMAFEAARAGKAGQGLYLLSKTGDEPLPNPDR